MMNLQRLSNSLMHIQLFLVGVVFLIAPLLLGLLDPLFLVLNSIGALSIYTSYKIADGKEIGIKLGKVFNIVFLVIVAVMLLVLIDYRNSQSYKLIIPFFIFDILLLLGNSIYLYTNLINKSRCHSQ